VPEAPEEGKLGQEAVVDIAQQLNCVWAGIAIDAAFEARHARKERIPPVELVLALYLGDVSRGVQVGRDNVRLRLGAR
jgi:hypothetical protein